MAKKKPRDGISPGPAPGPGDGTAMDSPKAVLFDMGGVLIDWRPRYLFARHFPGDEAGMAAFFDVLRHAGLETCRRPFAEVVPAFKAEHPHYAPLFDVFERDWAGFMRGALPDSVALLDDLRAAGTPLYGLTNWPAETFPPEGEAYAFLEHFEEILVSGEVGLIKPDPAIYHLTLERFGLRAAEVFFVDDLAVNVEAARALGLVAHHFTGAEGLKQALAHHRLIGT